MKSNVGYTAGTHLWSSRALDAYIRVTGRPVLGEHFLELGKGRKQEEEVGGTIRISGRGQHEWCRKAMCDLGENQNLRGRCGAQQA